MVPEQQGKIMKQPYHARLQKIMAEWIKGEGGCFGLALATKQVRSDAGVLTVDDVAKHMATAAMTAFETMQEVTISLGVDP
jgi:hypothetical protein